MSTSRDGLQILINVYYFVCVCVCCYCDNSQNLLVLVQFNSIHIQLNNNFFYVEKVVYI
jgi:hypothetical protein